MLMKRDSEKVLLLNQYSPCGRIAGTWFSITHAYWPFLTRITCSTPSWMCDELMSTKRWNWKKPVVATYMPCESPRISTGSLFTRATAYCPTGMRRIVIGPCPNTLLCATATLLLDTHCARGLHSRWRPGPTAVMVPSRSAKAMCPGGTSRPKYVLDAGSSLPSLIIAMASPIDLQLHSSTTSPMSFTRPSMRFDRCSTRRNSCSVVSGPTLSSLSAASGDGMAMAAGAAPSVRAVFISEP
mmetsp:Transcript_48796/g.150725  ORF Transcript_48796/g.150725 Transcript_48796/m.150725 type:complete len:241 (-) Transcript_48796:513-1235(-)